jgi:hypothetical protein
MHTSTSFITPMQSKDAQGEGKVQHNTMPQNSEEEIIKYFFFFSIVSCNINN